MRHAARWALMAVIVIGAMVPWYTLRLLPVLTLGVAKVNLLDALAACAVLLSAPGIVRGLVYGPRELRWVWALVVYMFAVPLINGLRDPDTAFFAIREVRPIAFYALALAFVAGKYTSRDFQRYSLAYLGGTILATIAVLLHVVGHTPLPGYVDVHPLGRGWAGVHYLDWTVPLEAFLFGLVGTTMARSLVARIGWIGACLLIVWYVLASTERFTLALIIGLAVAVPTFSWLPGYRPRRSLAIAALLAVAAVVAFQAVFGPAVIRDPVRTSLDRWSRAFSDDSLGFRLEELSRGLPRTARDLVVGQGLGGIVLRHDPERRDLPWRYVSDGYGFLIIRAGLIGLLLYLGMAITAIRAGWRNARAGHSGAWPAAAIGVAGIITLLILNVLYPAVDTPEGVIAFSLLYGMTVGTSSPPEGDGVSERLT